MSYIDNGSGLKPYDDSKTTIYYKKNTILNSNNDRNYYDNLFDKIIKDDLTKNDLKNCITHCNEAFLIISQYNWS